jgi:hypothetical protein
MGNAYIEPATEYQQAHICSKKTLEHEEPTLKHCCCLAAAYEADEPV